MSMYTIHPVAIWVQALTTSLHQLTLPQQPLRPQHYNEHGASTHLPLDGQEQGRSVLVQIHREHWVPHGSDLCQLGRLQVRDQRHVLQEIPDEGQSC